MLIVCLVRFLGAAELRAGRHESTRNRPESAEGEV